VRMFVCVLRVLMKSLITRGFRPVTTVTEGNGGGMECKSAVYIYPLRFAGRILRQGRRVRPFFWVWIRMFERFSWSVGFLSFLIKLKWFSPISYISPMRDSQLRYGPSRCRR
jgi:hypothetical protein